MLYREISDVSSEIHTKLTNTLYVQYVDFLDAKTGYINDNNQASKSHTA
jgi:hypothetical protein